MTTKEIQKLQEEAHAAADYLAEIEDADDEVLEAARMRVSKAEQAVEVAEAKELQKFVDAEEAERKKADAVYAKTFEGIDLNAIPSEEPLSPTGDRATKENAFKAARIAKNAERDKARLARQKERKEKAAEIRAASAARKQLVAAAARKNKAKKKE